MIKRKKIQRIQTTNDNQENKDFFSIKYDKEGNFKDIEIDYNLLIDCLQSLGLSRYDLEDNNGVVFVKVESQIVSHVTVVEITDIFLDHVSSLDFSRYDGKINAEKLKNKLYKGICTYFNQHLLSRMRPSTPIIINRDTKAESFFYFRNGFVKCNKDGWNFFDYSQLSNHIWKHQILNRDFNLIDIQNREIKTLGNFADFIFKVAKENHQRFLSLCSIIGYILNNYTNQKLKAIIFTDSKISDIPDGRTGKTLLCKALGQVRSYCEINGKDFDVTNRHKYQEVKLDCDIVHLNDVKKDLAIEALFNDITEGIKIERKRLDPVGLKVKMIISTNRTIEISGASAKDRVIEFEFSDYFSDKLSPQDIYSEWFFTDWEKNEWMLFDNLMMFCSSVFHKEGIIKVENINLENRKILEQTSPEFFEFMEDLNIMFEQWYAKQELYNSFKTRYPDYALKLTQRRFTSWLRFYAANKKGLRPFDKNEDEMRSNGIDYITFRSI